MRVVSIVAAAAFVGIGATTALSAPSLSDPALSPTSWSATQGFLAGWIQTDFDPGLLGPARVEVNLASDGSASGAWQERGNVAAPLASGPNGVIGISVADLVGRHQVRVVVDGALNSPLDLGVLQLDRVSPGASAISVTTQGATAEADWIQGDDRSGTDPASPVVAEINASPTGDGSGEWTPFSDCLLYTSDAADEL